VTTLSVGGFSVCGLADSTHLACWGGNGLGQLGLGTADSSAHAPGTVVGIP
jgi:hypothetical protein